MGLIGYVYRSIKATAILWITISVLAVALVGAASFYDTTIGDGDGIGPEPFNDEKVERLVREDINEIRAERGLSTLSSEAGLREQARSHSVDMAEHDEMAHDLPGSKAGERLSLAECSYGGENVAQSWEYENLDTAEGEIYTGDEEDLAKALVIGWMNSPPHKENILTSDWSETGVGIKITESGKVFATQKFCG